MTQKFALAIKRADLFALNALLNYNLLTGKMTAEMPCDFYSLTTTFENRATCETDTNLLQLLPYCVVKRLSDEKIFVYCRGKGGEEARLHGNLSIGIGGHVDTDTERAGHGLDSAVLLHRHLGAELLRELEEEIGFKNSAVDGEDLITDTLIYDDTNPVGQVHLGIKCELIVQDERELGGMETGVIEGSQWMSLGELMEPSVFSRLENWSQILVLDAYCQ
jgi:predicted NUDIX family phosphoesterase